jgi:hypothetical protein
MVPEIMNKKLEWKHKQDLAHLIMKSGGVIFGGFVRDSLLHDHYAKKYYEKCIDLTLIEEDFGYNDEKIFPETKHRMVIPHDIDSYFDTAEKLQEFEKELTKHKYTYERVFTREDATQYLRRLDVPEKSISHIRYRINFMGHAQKQRVRSAINSTLSERFYKEVKSEVGRFLEKLMQTSFKLGSVYIDVLLQKEHESDYEIIDPPFGNIDFECNGLVMTEDGIRLSKRMTFAAGMLRSTAACLELKRIMEDILKKKAVIVDSRLDPWRVEKMRRKGWEIVAPFKNIEQVKHTPEEKHICIICHEEFDTEVHYKLKCCNARYHKMCLLNTITTGTSAMQFTDKCIVCKRNVKRIDHDGDILAVL